MSYTVENTIFTISNPMNKYWYSKYKKDLCKDKTEFIKTLLNDAYDKKTVKYTPRYYACAKFIRATTNLNFVKKNILVFYINTTSGYFDDVYIVNGPNDFKCSKVNKLIMENNKFVNNGKIIGKCENSCCTYRRKIETFTIRWL